MNDWLGCGGVVGLGELSGWLGSGGVDGRRPGLWLRRGGVVGLGRLSHNQRHYAIHTRRRATTKLAIPFAEAHSTAAPAAYHTTNDTMQYIHGGGHQMVGHQNSRQSAVSCEQKTVRNSAVTRLVG